MNQDTAPPHEDEDYPYQYTILPRISPAHLDVLLADGWRHFGTYFFRNKLDYLVEVGSDCTITPLRINLAKFSWNKSHRKLLRRVAAAGVQVVYRPAVVDARKHELFALHRRRFSHNVPRSLLSFVDENPAEVPCPMWEVDVLDKDGLLYAASFIDVAAMSVSSVYAIFDPAYQALSPGIHTLLAEIEYALAQGKQYVYTGYAFREASHYDYKKRFAGVEYYDWKGNWHDIDQSFFQ